MGDGKTSSKAARQQSPAIKWYLTAYNFIQTIGWSYLLFLLVSHHLSERSANTLYETVKWPLIIFQNLAVLEVVHAATRMVSSNPIATGVQVWSRVFLVCGILLATQAPRTSVGLHIVLAAWSLTEIIRYGNYTLALIGSTPFIVTYLRYTTFIVLYPLGVFGELLCMYAAQKEIGKTQIFTVRMPNPVNFIFDYQLFIWITMAIYTPGLFALYTHMWTLRRKVLGGGQQKKIN